MRTWPPELVYQGMGTGPIIQFTYWFFRWFKRHKTFDKIHCQGKICIWLALQDINNNPILRTYNLFKKEFKWECYLNWVKNPKYRKALTKFRLSSHTLEIERGRHTNPTTPLEQRQCRICHVWRRDSFPFMLPHVHGRAPRLSKYNPK